MLNFRRGPKPRNYLSRREQWRLLMLVLTLGLVIFLMAEARKPKYYQWLGLADDDRAGTAEPRPAGPGLLSGARDGGLPAAGTPTSGISTSNGPATGVPTTEGGAASTEPLRLDPSSLDGVRDNKPLGPSEWGVWMEAFNVLAQHDEAAIRAASSGPVSYVQLWEQSPDYRGELVSTSGIVRRAHAAKTPRNPYGLTDYYQVWLWPDDHLNDPMVVWCLHLPQDFPLGMEMAEPVEVTGFYLKRWLYKSADGKARGAPMLFARTLHWRARPRAEASRREPYPVLPLAAAAALFAVLATGYVYYRTRKSAPPSLKAPLTPENVPAADAPDVGATLQQLADSENADLRVPEQKDAPDA